MLVGKIWMLVGLFSTHWLSYHHLPIYFCIMSMINKLQFNDVLKMQAMNQGALITMLAQLAVTM